MQCCRIRTEENSKFSSSIKNMILKTRAGEPEPEPEPVGARCFWLLGAGAAWKKTRSRIRLEKKAGAGALLKTMFFVCYLLAYYSYTILTKKKWFIFKNNIIFLYFSSFFFRYIIPFQDTDPDTAKKYGSGSTTLSLWMKKYFAKLNQYSILWSRLKKNTRSRSLLGKKIRGRNRKKS